MDLPCDGKRLDFLNSLCNAVHFIQGDNQNVEREVQGMQLRGFCGDEKVFRVPHAVHETA